ncbi:aminotransferase class V-fold PLP-dependent enzyme [Arthrobacter bambusae]|uniref:Selenocysteine lyase/cysteine desulfurase n=1 Tax=Arthrobacter bambusae TaxID=1338426 RepID=A0AAW8DCX9_9MICC|nr:aminotransferase class V-fold PLP-dependent enzyme [Arthrobacter bambusae]MDP9906187.1 selenocysteine lyase/cysteine desulfurase [Arthrobacter bambusae]MDQ0130580.1 selenocysteine lyase/cysteine desulfurase [Arthrobacter bambusae]MDQ0182255.1 selenocysteine lyase/cysteine desulfurase [Arthrobacter bambusae]
MTTMTPEVFRAQFPGLERSVHLASCSQGALSRELAGELLDFQSSIMERGAPWDLWMEKVEEARNRFAAFIGASPQEIAVVPNASAGAYQIASTQTYGNGRDRIITSELEFPSVANVWVAQEARGAKIGFAQEHAGTVCAEDYAALIDERTKLVSVPLITYRNGSRLPVAEVIQIARAHGAKTFIDAYQGAGVEPINVRELGCDYLVTGSLKYMLGVAGVAFLYVRGGLTDEVSPQLTGWFGRRDPFAFDPRAVDYPETARRFESGTYAVPAVYAAIAGMKMLAQIDQTEVQRHVAALTRELTEELTTAGLQLDSPLDAARRGPQVALIDENPSELAAFLESKHIIASPRGRAVRIAFHYYNLSEDITTLLKALDEWRHI